MLPHAVTPSSSLALLGMHSALLSGADAGALGGPARLPRPMAMLGGAAARDRRWTSVRLREERAGWRCAARAAR